MEAKIHLKSFNSKSLCSDNQSIDWHLGEVDTRVEGLKKKDKMEFELKINVFNFVNLCLP